eukprot:NODE_78_length_2582_cov_174.146467_g59_i0.p1 GENE.NODE_78_length_2582_cov_174.146467_g59_i0~~NODE_78_length_2582_cov_174.146467_g59_i0.p1  ORF type:complete len:807 (-),score=166.51 NODE_78_length_2582_cov_174.146467_g59_i0:161-2461(-)
MTASSALDSEAAAVYKAKGDAACRAGLNFEAESHYSRAVLHDPLNPSLYLNRSAMYLLLGEYTRALSDSILAIHFNPTNLKGYCRKGLALRRLNRFTEARQAYEAGLAATDVGGQQVEDIQRKNVEEAMTAVCTEEVLFLKERGNACYKRGDHTEAIELYSKAINLDMKNHLLWCNRASSHLALQQFGHALTDADMCTNLEPTFSKAWARKGAALVGLRRYGEAVVALERGQQLSPPDPSILDTLAQARQKLKDQEEAVRLKATANDLANQDNHVEAAMTLTKALQLDPFNHILYSNRSALKLGLSDYVQALLDADQTIALSPQFAKGYRRRAEALREMRLWDEACKTLRDGIRADPENEQLLTTALQTLENEQDQVLQDLDRPLTAETQERVRALREEGGVAFEAGDFTRAVACLSEAVKLDVNNSGLYAARGSVIRSMGHPAVALLDAECALQLDAQDTKAIALKGDCLLSLGRHSHALEIFENGVERDPDSILLNERKSRAEDQLRQAVENEKSKQVTQLKEQGNKATQEGVFQEALRLYTAAITLDPSNALLHSNRSAAYCSTLNYAAALEDAQAALKLNPTYIKGYSRLGCALRGLRRMEESVSAYRKALGMDPSNAALKGALADTEAAAQKTKSALELKERGNQATQGGNHSMAIQCYTQAIGYDGTDPVLYNNRSGVYCSLQDFGSALADAERAIELAPNLCKAWSRKGAAMHGLGRMRDSLEAYRKGLQVDPENSVCQSWVQQLEPTLAESTLFDYPD